MPQAPNLDGLPVWLRITVTVVFCLMTMFVAMKGYRRVNDREPPGAAQTVLASIPDMGAVRQLTDTCRLLCSEIEKLESSVRDQTHYLRDKIDVDRELCMRMRELKEELIRNEQQRHRRRVSRKPGS